MKENLTRAPAQFAESSFAERECGAALTSLLSAEVHYRPPLGGGTFAATVRPPSGGR
jgi:hypothetical protein